MLNKLKSTSPTVNPNSTLEKSGYTNWNRCSNYFTVTVMTNMISGNAPRDKTVFSWPYITKATVHVPIVAKVGSG